MKKTPLTRLGLLILAVVLGAAGCVVEASFNPIGHELSVSGSWTINGMPANASTCAAAGIASVRMVFFSGTTSYQYNDFTFACADGAFDSTPNLVLSRGQFTTQWRAYDAAGNEVGRMAGMLPLDTTPLVYGGHVNLAPADFIVTPSGFSPLGAELSASSSWTINGTPPTAALCSAAGIANVALVFQDSGMDYKYDALTFPCAQGSFDSGTTLILRRGSFTTQWRAFNAAGTEVGRMAGTNPLVTTSLAVGGHVNLQPADFIVALGEELRVNLRWDTTVGPTMTDADCATAGVAVMTYRLMLGGSMVAGGNMTDTACGAAIVFPDSVVNAGSYSLYVEGGTATVKSWMATCNGLDLMTNEHAEYNCFVDKVM